MAILNNPCVCGRRRENRTGRQQSRRSPLTLAVLELIEGVHKVRLHHLDESPHGPLVIDTLIEVVIPLGNDGVNAFRYVPLPTAASTKNFGTVE